MSVALKIDIHLPVESVEAIRPVEDHRVDAPFLLHHHNAGRLGSHTCVHSAPR